MQDADALVILTDWPDFARLDLERVKAQLAGPIVFDGRNLYEPAEMAARGITYISTGRPAAEPCAELVPLARRA